MNRYLIIRFSSFGDIMQALPAADCIRRQDPSSEIHWLTRQDFAPVLKRLKALDRVWGLARGDGLVGLLKFSAQLANENLTHVYDAHSNVRSTLMCLFLRLLYLIQLKPQFKLVRRSKSRVKRYLLFHWQKNLFPRPFRGAVSYLEPLRPWFEDVTIGTDELLELENDTLLIPPDLQKRPLDFAQAVALAPGAAWDLKRWPDEYWLELVRQTPQQNYVLLGGPEDEICKKIAAAAPGRVVNLAGRLSWLQSLFVLHLSRGLVACDTGLMHAADVMGKPVLALIGPTAFGFPTRATSKVLDVELSCRPCTKDGRGRCRNSEYKRCMKEITPAKVAGQLHEL